MSGHHLRRRPSLFDEYIFSSSFLNDITTVALHLSAEQCDGDVNSKRLVGRGWCERTWNKG